VNGAVSNSQQGLVIDTGTTLWVLSRVVSPSLTLVAVAALSLLPQRLPPSSPPYLELSPVSP
jgi:hypothetical protein